MASEPPVESGNRVERGGALPAVDTTSGRPPRSRPQPEAIRDLMLEAGLEILERDGLGLEADSISYAKLFAYLEDRYSVRVTRGSVHERIWASHDNFRRDVLAEAIPGIERLFPTETSSPIGTDQPGPPDAEDTLSPNGLARMFIKSLESAPFAQVQSAKAIASRYDDPVAVDGLQRVFNERAESILASRRARIPAGLALRGLRPKRELGLNDQQAAEVFHIVCVALFVGGYLDYHAGSPFLAEAVDFMGMPANGPEPWLGIAIGIQSINNFLYVSAPGYRPATDALPSPTPPDPLPRIDGIDPTARRTRQQLKQLVLTGGVELFLRDGLDLQLQSLRYSAVFAHIEQTRGISLYRTSVDRRVWADQDHYCLDVLTLATTRRPVPSPEVAEQVDAEPIAFAPATNHHPEQNVRDVIRMVTKTQLETVANSVNHQLHQLIKASLPHMNRQRGGPVESLRSAIADYGQRRIHYHRNKLQQQLHNGGFQVRPELQITDSHALDIMANLAAATTLGAFFDHRAGIEAATRTIPLPRLDDPTKTDDWTPTGIAHLAFFNQLFERSAA